MGRISNVAAHGHLALSLMIAAAVAACGGGESASVVEARASILALAPTPAGSNCTFGGKTVTTGLDTNGDGVLQASEVTDTVFACDGGPGSAGAAGADGVTALVDAVSEPAGSNCAAGGTRITFGLDANRSAVLDGSEVAGTRYACNGGVGASGATGATGSAGATGSNAVASVVAEPAGANCAAGGSKLSSGIDLNGNGQLDAAEVALTGYVCNGAAATNGKSSLTSFASEPGGAHCATGGAKITSGLDVDGNGVLDAGEVTRTAYSCNGAQGSQGTQGAAGLNSLVDVSTVGAGATCASGGSRFTAGLDANRNGVLDAIEVSSTSVLCGPAAGVPGANAVSATAVQMVSGQSYLALNASTAVVATLPASPTVGDSVQVSAGNGAGWKIAQNAGQSIYIDKIKTAVTGSAGSVNWTVRSVGTYASTGAWYHMAGNNDGSILYAANNTGLGKSTDKGVTWTSVFSSYGLKALAVSSTGSVVYAGASTSSVLLKSTDFGATWNILAGSGGFGTGAPVSLATNADGSVVALTDASGVVYVSTDGGASFGHSGPFNGSSPALRVAMAADGLHLAVAEATGYVYTSTDSGTNWTQRSPNGGQSTNWTAIGYAGDASKLVALPQSGKSNVSSDGGVTWSQGATSYNWATISVSADGKRIVAGTTSNGQIQYSTDGLSWAAKGSSASDNYWDVYVAGDGSFMSGIKSVSPNAGNWFFTFDKTATTVGTGGGLLGDAYSAITLIYIGGGVWAPNASVGTFTLQ